MFTPTRRLLKVFALALLLLIFYFIERVAFLVWNWSLFHSKAASDIATAFLVGTRFDLSAVFSLMAPVLLLAVIPWPERWERIWEKTTWLIFSVLNVIFLLLNGIDTELINFVGRRFTVDSLFVVGESQGKFFNFVGGYWPLASFNVLLCVVLVWSSYRLMRAPRRSTSLPASAKMYSAHAFLCLVAIIITVVAIRGGLQKKPVNFVNASMFTAPILNNLCLNSTFTLIKSYGKEGVKREVYFSDRQEMLSLMNGSFTGSALEGHRPDKPQNVVIIILESFGSEYTAASGGKSYTPFLDSLAAKSLSFRNGYANGRRSIEGVAAVMGGVPALMNEPFISSNFTSNLFLGLGTLLAEKKYTTSFFHGGHNGTMYFDSFMKSAGVENYFGASEYNNSQDDDGVWGIWDEPFLQWMVTKIDTMPQPFMASVFTLSSHQPFKVPEKYKEQFPEGPIEILKAVSYSDYALKRFFEEAAKKPWYKDTLFILTADHTSIHYRDDFDNDVGNYRVPIILYHPSFQFPEVDKDMVVQQIDILPTVLDFLGIQEKDKNYLESSMFVPGDKVAVSYIDGRYLLMAKDYYLVWVPAQGADPVMYDIKDTAEHRALTEPADRKTLLVKKLKAAVQYFNEGMWDNKLYYPTLRK